ncbi:hypothetical protein [Kribbella sp. NPDC051620]|uniref:hypothetical protein n=1 Tax=Kribbella sp. NPDC051620 TaxID=3364120 RepID=UPI003787748D
MTRLFVALREGDAVEAASSPFGAEVAFAMERLGTADDRWQQLDGAMVACTVEVSGTTNIRELTVLALTAAREAGQASGVDGIRTWLSDPATDEPFAEDETVSAAGLLDGDLVVLTVQHPMKGMYDFIPAPDPAGVFAQLQYSDRARRRARKIRGVLLYTDADVELATFVRTHFDELNTLSGELFQISVFERPRSWRTAKRYWKDRLSPEEYRMLTALRWLKWTPYDKLGAYEVARELGVPASELPCLVLLPYGRDKYVFPLGATSMAAFRRLFGELSATIESADPDESGGIVRRLAAAEQRLRAELVPAARGYEFNGATVVIHTGGQAMTENFNFHGQTTFINRPVNTVITDFQNSHPTGTDLTTLLRLVLDSEQLTDDQREQVAQLINEVAGELDSGTPDTIKTRRQLDRIKTTVSKAADIATPALTIIAKVLELLP